MRSFAGVLTHTFSQQHGILPNGVLVHVLTELRCSYSLRRWDGYWCDLVLSGCIWTSWEPPNPATPERTTLSFEGGSCKTKAEGH